MKAKDFAQKNTSIQGLFGCIKYLSLCLPMPLHPAFFHQMRCKCGEESSTQAHERANPRPCKNQNAIHLSAKDEHQDSGREKGGSGEPAGCVTCFSAQMGRGNRVAGCFPQASGSAQSCDYFQAGGDARPRKASRRASIRLGTGQDLEWEEDCWRR